MDNRTFLLIWALMFIGLLGLGALPVYAEDERLSVWIKNLDNDNVLIRKNAIFYLGWVRDPRSLPHLYQIVEHSDEDELKIEAIEAMLRVPRKKSLELLKSLLGRGFSSAVQRKMRHAIEIFEILELKKKLP